ncbi:restriction endonuclease [Listeria seeligeri]|uniref:restriction endonuclease n=1 Tax=Listeria seeligeri TaxID=1640 RepID=UPI001629BE63|nr:restriction endonuclease [Listeria seeligeri]MBC1533464.1 restriction endonuclease [Listeria seeligeri]MBC1539150.1 restriction endonuclease [Listeria seeligeri]MBC1554537.1 restriction endonuclease [Listeria seeligeri]MBC1733798.1 restriction endonuclease [Listeria seeligeri]MBC1740480.1 restriction endonuclease [Listeria seeligeri]
MTKQVETYIQQILEMNYGKDWKKYFDSSELFQYLNLKSGAIHGNSKTRRSLANWYAIFSILSFYKDEGFINNRKDYSNFEGFPYSKLFEFQRQQYGGSKLQNHGFNSRTNDEFANKISRDVSRPLIVKDKGSYLVHPDFLYVNGKDITEVVLEIIEKYKTILMAKDHSFIEVLEELTEEKTEIGKKEKIKLLLNDDSEARIFEIISYAILETHYKNQSIFFGWSREDITEEFLNLYKTGRTNANDGGIDFVMRPLGRFFQVTEVNNYDKYFLDMDKVNHFPLTFIVKTHIDSATIKNELLAYGTEKSGGLKILESAYHSAVEEVITINELTGWLENMNNTDLNFLIEEIDRYFKVEMNIEE